MKKSNVHWKFITKNANKFYKLSGAFISANVASQAIRLISSVQLLPIVTNSEFVNFYNKLMKKINKSHTPVNATKIKHLILSGLRTQLNSRCMYNVDTKKVKKNICYMWLPTPEFSNYKTKYNSLRSIICPVVSGYFNRWFMLVNNTELIQRYDIRLHHLREERKQEAERIAFEVAQRKQKVAERLSAIGFGDC